MKRVLVVNDCRFESMIMKDFLSDIGYNVQVTNEYDTFIQIKVFQPDIIIVNLIMKDNRGDRLINNIKNNYPGILCLLSSCDSIKLQDFIQSKVDEVIHTPVTRSKLSEILDEALDKFYSRHDEYKNIEKDFKGLTRENLKENKNEKTALVLNEETNVKLPNKFLFCPYCGGKFTEEVANFLFCPFCGQKLK
ncbi:response regulator [Clostridium sp. A1-XYC3]|uniref:Stage 0 sporulation protein A homolog n=1 Tax=Clostridium tanneri TaxID=3037988 RepID=A0ABU4JPD5_9CLOT|nr:response regulator [Clostridium sp. A1-XYC3]MDW8799995.1 response regulator [Clostridium sp. A1-XYC3]